MERLFERLGCTAFRLLGMGLRVGADYLLLVLRELCSGR